ncbi:MAG: protein-L-isoaspartate(D-aspartate) O-methyltransferase [Alphaproteobacteria bacterium]
MSGWDDRAKLILSLRQAGLTDMALLSAIEQLPREEFLPEEVRSQAYADVALPIECGQYADPPLRVARMTAALELGDRMKVLEIGTGCGFHAAVLAALCRRVYTVERHRTLSTQAAVLLTKLGLHNVTTLVGDGRDGWPLQAPFDRIVVSATAPELPAKLLEQLAIDGIMIVPIGSGEGEHQLMRIRKDSHGINAEPLEVGYYTYLEPGLGREQVATG